MLNYTIPKIVPQQPTTIANTPSKTSTPAQEGVSPSGFCSAHTNHRWSLQKGNMQKQANTNKKGKLTEMRNTDTLHNLEISFITCNSIISSRLDIRIV